MLRNKSAEDRLITAENVKKYIENHLGENIEIELLCEKFGIGRTKLYEKVFIYNLKISKWRSKIETNNQRSIKQ